MDKGRCQFSELQKLQTYIEKKYWADFNSFEIYCYRDWAEDYHLKKSSMVDNKKEQWFYYVLHAVLPKSKTASRT